VEAVRTHLAAAAILEGPGIRGARFWAAADIDALADTITDNGDAA
jgi:hypothetical protein